MLRTSLALSSAVLVGLAAPFAAHFVTASIAAQSPSGEHAHGRAAASARGTAAQPPAVVGGRRYVPDSLTSTAWLERLAAAQTTTIGSARAFHDFRFADQLAATGITFHHHAVDDAARTYKAAHYDHGNGLAAADVDGDGLVDLYFVNQVGGNELWLNLGSGRFANVTTHAAVAVPGRVSVSASFADIDNDGDPDLYVTTVRGGNLLFENDGHGCFKDITAASGLSYTGHSSGAVFFDYDRDGRLDLFLVNVGKYTTDVQAGADTKFYTAFEDAFSGHLKPERTERSILYHNEGKNRFVDVSQRMNLVDTSWSGDASIIDGNDDGWPDLYVLNMEGDDQYYENEQGRRFEKKSRQLFPRTSWGAMGIKSFDFNNDGRMDVFITDMHSDMSQPIGPELEKLKSDMQWPESFRGTGRTSIWGNTFFVKDGADRYREVSDALGLESYCPWGPSVGDLNADGFDDVFIASGMNYPERYEITSVKLNDGGRRFVDAEFVLGVEPRAGSITAPWFDVDPAGRDKGHRDAAGATSPFTVYGARASRSAVVFDIDGDGDLDVVTNEFNTAPMVLISNLSQRTQVHYLAVRLSGTRSNHDGIGATVKVVTGDRTQTQVMDGNSGYLSHSTLPLYFGLGAATSVDRIEITWPSGTKQTIAGPAINKTMAIREEPAGR